MTEVDANLLLRFFKALGHESRLKLIGLLAQSDRTVQELARLLDLSEPTISHHLGLLRELDLVRLRPEGNLHWYAFRPDGLAHLAKSLLSPKKIARWADKKAEIKTDPTQAPDRLIQNYLDSDGRLRQIPASRKKRRTVLAWLANHFDNDRRYREAEVNQILQGRHWDSATLRRELVGYRMLARAQGVYWRLPEEQWRKVEIEKAK